MTFFDNNRSNITITGSNMHPNIVKINSIAPIITINCVNITINPNITINNSTYSTIHSINYVDPNISTSSYNITITNSCSIINITP